MMPRSEVMGLLRCGVAMWKKYLAIFERRKKTAHPFCLCYNYGLCPELPMEIGIPFIVRAAERARVPVATILDHGEDLEMVMMAIHCGVSSVMFDGSHFPYEENVRQTKEVIRIAHAVGISVEAELGAVGGSAIETGGTQEPESVMTDPMQAKDFVGQTGVDALAISFGNVHGSYKGEPELDLGRVRTISELVPVPLVMHGASGLKESDYGAIVASGISKLNYHTAMSKAAALYIRREDGRWFRGFRVPQHHELEHAVLSERDQTFVRSAWLHRQGRSFLSVPWREAPLYVSETRSSRVRHPERQRRISSMHSRDSSLRSDMTNYRFLGSVNRRLV